MTVGVAKITAEGYIVLPPEIMDKIGEMGKFLVFQGDNDTILLKKIHPPSSPKHLSEIADRLAALNEVAPITPDEVEAELRAYRADPLDSPLIYPPQSGTAHRGIACSPARRRPASRSSPGARGHPPPPDHHPR